MYAQLATLRIIKYLHHLWTFQCFHIQVLILVYQVMSFSVFYLTQRIPILLQVFKSLVNSTCIL